MTFWNLATSQLEEFRPGILSKAEFGDNLKKTIQRIKIVTRSMN